MKKTALFLLLFIFNFSFIYANNNLDLCNLDFNKTQEEINNTSINIYWKNFNLKNLLEKNKFNINYKNAQNLAKKALTEYEKNNITLEQRDFILLLLQNLQNTKDYCTDNKEQINNVIHTWYNWTTWSYYKWNYVYWAAMDLAWSELKENIIWEDIRLNISKDDKILNPNLEKLLKEFNNTIFSKKDLDEKSYYVKAWYWQKTVDTINKESKEKFPDKSFKDLEMKLWKYDIISYAYFFKNFDFFTAFLKDTVYFNKIPVKWFKYGATSPNYLKQRKNISILNYKNDDNFIIKLNLKDFDDDFFVAKWYNMTSTKEVLDDLQKYKDKKLEDFWDNDYFQMPNINFDFKRNYEEFINKLILNSKFNKTGEDYIIAKMYENIKFALNNKWVKVENEAVVVMYCTSAWFNENYIPPKERHFYLNKPFWIIMKSHNSNNPYLIIWINNTALMQK